MSIQRYGAEGGKGPGGQHFPFGCPTKAEDREISRWPTSESLLIRRRLLHKL